MAVIEPKQTNLEPSHGSLSAITEHHVEGSLGEVLWRRKWTIFFLLAIACGAGYAYYYFAPRTYTSSASLYVGSDKPRMIENEGGRDTAAKGYAAMQAQVIGCEEVLRGALAQPAVADLQSVREHPEPLEWLRSSVVFQGTDKSDVLSITCTSQRRDEPAPIVDALVKSYVAYQMRHEQSNSQQLQQILQKELDKLQSKRAEIAQAMAKFKETNGIMSLSMDKGNIIMDRLSTLSQALTAAEMEAIEADTEAQTAKLAAADPDKFHQAFQAHQLQDKLNWETQEETQLRQSLSQMRTKLSALLAVCTEEAPAVKASRQKIAEIEAQLSERSQRLAGAYLASTSQQSKAAQERVGKLRQTYAEQQKLAQALNVQAVNYALLETDAKRADKLVADMDTRIKELALLGDTGGMNVVLLQGARAPRWPSSPNKLIIALVSPVVGLLLGAAFAVIRERRDLRLRRGTEVGALLGAPVLGVVPRRFRGRKLPHAARWITTAPRSAVAEALRAMRAGILMRTESVGASILVTSPTGQEGKSMTASNMAIGLAQMGHRTLIIDGNLRCPVQHKIFGVTVGTGLATALEIGGKKSSQFILPTDIQNLDILPAGKCSMHPLDLLSSTAMATMMDDLARTYRYIIIDSPSVLPLADTPLLASRVDATIMVLRAGVSDRATTAQAREVLYGVRAQIMGTVINHARDAQGPLTRWACHTGHGRFELRIASAAASPSAAATEPAIKKVS